MKNQRRVVARCCQLAYRGGVRAGMPAAQARALFGVGAVRIDDHDPDRDHAALRRLANWALRISPLVAIDEPDGLLLDVTGCHAAHGGEDKLLRLARDGPARLGFQTRAAIAPTFGAAWAIARHADHAGSIVQMPALRAALAPLPVRSLRIEADGAATLSELGIATIGDVLNLPRSTLPARFGDELLLRLDQAFGQAIETIRPIRPAPPPDAAMAFDGPTDRLDAIEQATRHLITVITGELLRSESGARALRVTLMRSDLPPVELDISLGRPSREPRHLWTLLAPKLERANLGFGVEGVRVSVRSAGRLRHEQSVNWGDTSQADPDDRDFTELIDTLTNRLGQDRVLAGRLSASHLPERANRLERWTDSRTDSPSAEHVSRDRPTTLLAPPLPAEVLALTPDGPVHRVRWRDGDEPIITSTGPERIAPEWWRANGSTRDYFTVQTESGRWLWLARGIESGRWHVHGLWA